MEPYINVWGRTIPTYGICMAAGILAASIVGFLRTRKAHEDVNNFFILVACAAGLGLIAAKLLYIAVSVGLPKAVVLFGRGDFSLLSGGGSVFYGGVIGGILGLFVARWIAKINLEVFTDILVPCLPLGQAFGRVGCFCAGCCYGIPYAGIGSIRFPESVLGLSPDVPVFPIQPLCSLFNLLLFIALLFLSRRIRGQYRLLQVYLVAYAVGRFFLEFLRGDAIRASLWGLSTSQWISLGILAAVLLFRLWLRREKQGGSAAV
ncbi:MAG TPA: prolipoprotein diacylglyceryl transferase [Candidatus Limiplasma sp.]|nr:prolipoprotein diacylglyceryl transferase [Candidatus Limiplasma sp.]